MRGYASTKKAEQIISKITEAEPSKFKKYPRLRS